MSRKVRVDPRKGNGTEGLPWRDGEKKDRLQPGGWSLSGFLHVDMGLIGFNSAYPIGRLHFQTCRLNQQYISTH